MSAWPNHRWEFIPTNDLLRIAVWNRIARQLLRERVSMAEQDLLVLDSFLTREQKDKMFWKITELDRKIGMIPRCSRTNPQESAWADMDEISALITKYNPTLEDPQ